MIKRILYALILLTFILSVSSCGEPEYRHCELVIPLSSEFQEFESEDFDVAYSDGTSVAAIVRISFVAAYNEGIPETLTPTEFGKFWVRKCQRDAEVISESGQSFCTYYEGEEGKEFFYLESFFRSHSAYFVVLFATPKSNEEAGRAEFLDYSSKVYFTE